jgi:CheY-like chemotaxis protein
VTSRPPNIVLCDDNEDDRFLFQEALSETSLETTLAIVDGGEALMDYLGESTVKPDAIFLDLNMPRKNGFECLKEIRRIEKFKATPIIIFSTSTDVGSINKTYDLGANLYVTKPSDFTALSGIIEQAILVIIENKFTQMPRNQFVLNERITSADESKAQAGK